MLLEAELEGLGDAEADEDGNDDAPDETAAENEPMEEAAEEAAPDEAERPTAELVELPRRASSHGGQ
jgi:hypothetical protein